MILQTVQPMRSLKNVSRLACQASGECKQCPATCWWRSPRARRRDSKLTRTSVEGTTWRAFVKLFWAVAAAPPHAELHGDLLPRLGQDLLHRSVLPVQQPLQPARERGVEAQVRAVALPRVEAPVLEAPGEGRQAEGAGDARVDLAGVAAQALLVQHEQPAAEHAVHLLHVRVQVDLQQLRSGQGGRHAGLTRLTHPARVRDLSVSASPGLVRVAPRVLEEALLGQAQGVAHDQDEPQRRHGREHLAHERSSKDRGVHHAQGAWPPGPSLVKLVQRALRRQYAPCEQQHVGGV
mmetsp:Transcript_83999/g.271489  ORF Transcript_83999/g.271489 Transcript_83999/m.271489 type:complete len:293 (-) Transcript_83999:76-954(-)